MFSREDFFTPLLALRSQAVLLECQRRLEALHPAQHVAHFGDLSSDFQHFLAQGQADRVGRHEAGALDLLSANEAETGVRCEPIHRWDEVTWQGTRYEVVHLTLREENCTDSYSFIVGPARAEVHALFLAVRRFSSVLHRKVLVFQNGGFQRSEALHAAIASAEAGALVLPAALQEDLLGDVRRFVTERETYARHRVPWKRGLLLLGPPGNGKTLTLRVLIHQTGWPCLYVKSFRGKRCDVEEGIHTVFERARKMAPCVLVLEDVDCLIDDDTRSALLNELDGFTENQGLLVVATTNHPEKLDRSLLDRPSRFDRKFHFPLPGPAERQRYLAQWSDGLAPELRLSPAGLLALVEGTATFTFAYLKELTLASTLAFMEARGGSMDEVAERTLTTLRGEMSSARKMLPPLPETERRISLS